MTFSSPHPCYMPRPTPSPWFYHLTTIWMKVPKINLPIIHFSPSILYTSHLIPPIDPSTSHSQTHLANQYIICVSQSAFAGWYIDRKYIHGMINIQKPLANVLPVIWDTKFYTHKKQQTELYITFVYFNVYMFKQKMERQRILSRMIAYPGFNPFLISSCKYYQIQRWQNLRVSPFNVTFTPLRVCIVLFILSSFFSLFSTSHPLSFVPRFTRFSPCSVWCYKTTPSPPPPSRLLPSRSQLTTQPHLPTPHVYNNFPPKLSWKSKTVLGPSRGSMQKRATYCCPEDRGSRSCRNFGIHKPDCTGSQSTRPWHQYWRNSKSYKHSKFAPGGT